MLKLTPAIHPQFEDEDLKSKVNSADPMVKQFISHLLLENKALQEKIVKNEVKYQSKQNYLSAKVAELERALKERPTQHIVIDRG
ncbi:MAG TPA: hypothetical protein VLG17_19620 [Pseudomonas sp.]|uniref:hypothetical protein n=1 Tax=Pseudomonas sp. TaxID=306 RepID=UPI002B61606A|nr:hypothetical protein [Pseudomonas sp.]HSX90191.1 hypothetical protein [Pseudomonas sp.]